MLILEPTPTNRALRGIHWRSALGTIAWVGFIAAGSACRAGTEPPAPSRTESARPVARPRPERMALPPVALEGTTCRSLEPRGIAAATRLLGPPAEAVVAAGYCSAGERLELSVRLEPGGRYVVDVVTVPPAGPVQVTLEVHPEVEARPLVETTVAAPEEELRATSFPDPGIVWQRPVPVQARLVLVAQRDVGVVAARLRATTTPPDRR